MKYHTLFFRKLGKMSQNLSSAAVVMGALRVNPFSQTDFFHSDQIDHSDDRSDFRLKLGLSVIVSILFKL